MIILSHSCLFVFIERVSCSEPGDPPIEGDPEALLEEWGRKLALRFDENMDVVPRYPVASPERPREPR